MQKRLTRLLAWLAIFAFLFAIVGAGFAIKATLKPIISDGVDWLRALLGSNAYIFDWSVAAYVVIGSVWLTYAMFFSRKPID